MNAMQMELRAIRAENARLRQMLAQRDAADKFLAAALGGYCAMGAAPESAAANAMEAADQLMRKLAGEAAPEETPAETQATTEEAQS
jgi:hypothetical protein